jgi:hypothetical protein
MKPTGEPVKILFTVGAGHLIQVLQSAKSLKIPGFNRSYRRMKSSVHENSCVILLITTSV